MMVDYITATEIISREFNGMYIDLAPEGFPMEEDEFNELMAQLTSMYVDMKQRLTERQANGD